MVSAFLFVSACSTGDDAEEQRSSVVGGTYEKWDSYPAVGKLTPAGSSYATCGATLIAPRAAITAAHCIDRSIKLSIHFPTGSFANVQRAIQHPSYSTTTLANDVAVLILDRAPTIKPLTIATPSPNEIARYVGYGRIGIGGQSVWSLSGEHKGTDERIFSLGATEIRVQGVGGGICYGDSGGPLLRKDPQLKGTVTYGVLSSLDGGYCDIGDIHTFTRLDAYQSFINETITTYASDAPTPTSVTSLSVGPSHNCAVLDNGRVKCWGDGSYGNLGLGNTNHYGRSVGTMGDALPYVDLGTGRKAVSVVAGDRSSCALLDNGALKCWGTSDFFGTLGLEDQNTRGDQPGEMGDALPAVNLGTGVQAKFVARPNGYTTCAILNNGSLKCWGNNWYGKLGLGHANHMGATPGTMGDALPAVDLGTGRTAKAVSVGGGFVCAILDNDMVKCWGNNTYGQLGLGDTNDRGDEPFEMGDALPYVKLRTGRTAVAITTSGWETCVLFDDMNVSCWGGFAPQTGTQIGDQPNEMGDALRVLELGYLGVRAGSITRGRYTMCATLIDGTLKCWGKNETGQLGLGHAQYQYLTLNLPTVNLGTGRTVKSVGTGDFHTCALLDDNTVKCWGGNQNGAVGSESNAFLGDHPSEMGDTLPAVKLFGK